MKSQSKSNVFNFFENTDNYNEAVKLCRNLVPGGNPKETLHEVYIKLAEKEQAHPFPKDHAHAIFFLVVVIKNHKINKEKRKLPKEVELDHAFDYVEDTTPEIMQKLDTLNALIQKEENLFTDEQLKLWKYMYECYPVEVIAKAMRKKQHSVYSLTDKMRAKIRKNFNLNDLFE